jgi:hypothetical protein
MLVIKSYTIDNTSKNNLIKKRDYTQASQWSLKIEEMNLQTPKRFPAALAPSSMGVFVFDIFYQLL